MSSKLCPLLPAEIWIKIIEQCYTESDVDQLWISHRFVCRNFKHAVEHLFINRHLSQTTIHYALDPIIDLHGFQSQEYLLFEFLGVSQDRQRAIFRAHVERDPDEFRRARMDDPTYDNIAGLRHALREASNKHESPESILHPNHTIEIHEEFNDTPIPGLRINPNSFHMFVDWKGMLTRFYGEKRHSARLITNGAPTKGCNRPEISPGVLAPFDTDNINWTQEGQWDVFYNAARRARISRMFKELGLVWVWMDPHLQYLEESKFGHLMLEKHTRDQQYNPGKR